MASSRARAATSALLNHVLRSAIIPRRALSTVVADKADNKAAAAARIDAARKNLMMQRMIDLDLSSQVGCCMPLSAMRIGTTIHSIEMRPGGGAQLVRSAGTCAKILKDPSSDTHVLVQLPSKKTKLFDTRCRATVGIVSNPGHGFRKLRKAGENRWRGWRPVVRGVAMNPIDHPHGGGEGKSKSSGSFGRTSCTPWGKPTKCGYKTARHDKQRGKKGKK